MGTSQGPRDEAFTVGNAQPLEEYNGRMDKKCDESNQRDFLSCSMLPGKSCQTTDWCLPRVARVAVGWPRTVKDVEPLLKTFLCLWNRRTMPLQSDDHRSHEENQIVITVLLAYPGKTSISVSALVNSHWSLFSIIHSNSIECYGTTSYKSILKSEMTLKHQIKSAKTGVNCPNRW